MDIEKDIYMPMPPKSRRKGYWVDKKTYDDIEKKIDELVEQLEIELEVEEGMLEKTKSLEDKLNQNDFEIIASGEVEHYVEHTEHGELTGIEFPANFMGNRFFKKYSGKNIQIGVRVIK